MSRCSAKFPYRFGITKYLTPRDFNIQKRTKAAVTDTAKEAVEEPAVTQEAVEEPAAKTEDAAGTKLDAAGFSATSIKNLEANEIFTVEQLEAYIATGETLEALPKIGERSAAKIEEELAQWKTETAAQNSID